MEWENFITYGLIGLVVSLALNYMNKGASQEIEKDTDGEVELRMHKFYRFLGFLSIGFALMLAIVVLYYQEKELYIIGLGMILLFGGLGGLCLLYYQNHLLRFNEERLLVQNWRKKTDEISWAEINKITFNPFSGYLKIRGLNKKMTVHQHLVGLQTFIQKMEEKTQWKASDLKLPFR